jgi:flagellar hook-length control protein FliK
MAVMLNMLPVEQKTTALVSKNMNKCGEKNDKSGGNFAKMLTNETDKKTDDTEGKSTDNAQLLAAMAGLVAPMVPKLGNLNSAVDNVPMNAVASLETVENKLQNQIPQLVVNAGNIEVATPVQIEVPKGVLTQANIGNNALDVQDVTIKGDILQGPVTDKPNLAAILEIMTPVKPQVFSEQPQLMIPNSNKEAAKQNLATGIMTPVSPQIDENPVNEDLGKWQAQLQNMQSLGQKPENNNKNTTTLLENPVVLTAVAATPILNGISLSSNSNKQLTGKKSVIDQVNVEAGTSVKDVGILEVSNVKSVMPTQIVVALGAQLVGKEQENELPKQTSKDSDVFVNMLTQQSMKVEQSIVMPEVKAVTAQPVNDPYNITSQIVDQARLVAGNKNTEMIIQLKPEHLGELTFKVSVENGVVSASFHSNNAEVRSMIETSLYQLKQEMSNQGLKIDNVGVYAGLGEFFSNGQQREGQQQPGTTFHNKKTEEDFMEALESIDPAKSSLDSAGVDYLV